MLLRLLYRKHEACMYVFLDMKTEYVMQSARMHNQRCPAKHAASVQG